MVNTGCVLVTYNPDLVLLKKAIESIGKQVSFICIIDNTESEIEFDLEQISVSNFVIIRNGQNLGIAAAQNIGIKYFIEKKYDYIIFMDQDSLPPENLVQKLIAGILFLNEEKYNVGGIAPTPYDRRYDEVYLNYSINSIGENLYEVQTIISSGTLIPVINFEKVGLMCNTLFIDGVDLEWCWRARNLYGFNFFLMKDVFLSHTLGNKKVNFICFNIYTQPPFRFYYRIRNYFILLGISHVPFSWKVKTFFSNQVKFLYYILYSKHRMDYLRKTFLGISAGLNYLFRDLCKGFIK